MGYSVVMRRTYLFSITDLQTMDTVTLSTSATTPERAEMEATRYARRRLAGFNGPIEVVAL